MFCRAVSSQRRHASTIGKKLVKRQYLLHMSSQYMANFGPLTAEIGSGVWGTPININGFRVLPSLLQRRRSPEANQTLHDVWPSHGLVHYIYIFGGSCPLTEFCPVQYSLYVQVLRFPVLAALLHGTPAAGVSQSLRRGTRSGITELSQRAPSIFGRAAITLGIDPHCNCSSVLCTFRKQKMTVLADSKVSDVKATWWFWNKRVGLCTYIGAWSWRNAWAVAVTIMSYGNIIMAVKCKIQLVEIIIFTKATVVKTTEPGLTWPGVLD